MWIVRTALGNIYLVIVLALMILVIGAVLLIVLDEEYFVWRF